jgi:CBS domain-containing protein
MLVRDVLKVKSGGAILIQTEATVAEAVAILVAHNIGSLPVLNERGALVGIFTERDVLRGVHTDCEHYVRRTVGEVMTPQPITCEPGDEVHEVMGKMSAFQVGQLPVVSAGEVVGLVSVGDLIRHLYAQAEEENRHLHGYIHGTP